MADTLVLDPSGLPIATMRWEDAVTLYVKDRVTVVDSDPDRILRSPSFEMEMPVVIKLKNDFARRQRREVPFSRRNVAIRDKSKCQYCARVLKQDEYTYDHVKPVSRGGKSTWKNLVLACVECNMHKANRTPEEAGMRLLTEPMKPSISDERFKFRLSIKKVNPRWKPWISWAYWNVVLDE